MNNWLIKSDGFGLFTFYPNCSFFPTFGEGIITLADILYIVVWCFVLGTASATLWLVFS